MKLLILAVIGYSTGAVEIEPVLRQTDYPG